MTTTRTTVDITPSPAILSVLAEIEFAPWQCIAELLDNAIDSFLAMDRAGTPIQNPQVAVAIGHQTVVVKDTGPGMSLDTLETAVKAGWTSQEKFGSLGLYGVGFNIATARLGSVTTIWTTQQGDPSWYGLEIDLQQLARGKSFTLPVKIRMKQNPQSSGTEIEVSKIRNDWKSNFQNQNWIRSNITDRLAKIYSTMLRDNNPQPIKFSLIVNSKKVTAWEHVIWPEDLTVFRATAGYIRPIQEINMDFGTKYYSRSTGQSFIERPTDLPEEDILEVQEHVYGWLGIQRYGDDKEYGIDILRNGRKIEVGCKDFFMWENENGDLVPEYPIDDLRARLGRIVGEIHLNHGYVNYTKHRFEREHSSWKQLGQAIRYNEPLTLRKESGFGKDKGYSEVNESPLGTLFRAFRRSTLDKRLSYRELLLIKENDVAKKWANEFRKGTPSYRNEDNWVKLLESYDVTQPTTPSIQDQSSGDGVSDAGSDDSGEATNILDTGGILVISEPSDTAIEGKPTSATPIGNSPTATSNNGTISPITTNASPSFNGVASTQPPKIEVKRTPIPDLSLRVTGIGISGTAYNVEVYAIEPVNATNLSTPWKAAASPRGVYEIEINQRHSVFNSTSLQVRDAVLAEVAHYIASEESSRVVGNQEGVSFGEILLTLRSRYATTDSLEAAQLLKEIEEIRKRLTTCLNNQLSEDSQREILNKLPENEGRKIALTRAQDSSSSSLVSFFEPRHLAYLLRNQPELFFDAGCFNRSWTPPTLANDQILLEEHRKAIVRDLLIPLEQLADFTSAAGSVRNFNRPYMAFIRACLNLVRESLVSTS